jgi:hypothetical protein
MKRHHFDFEQLGPLFAGDEEAIAQNIVGDSV